MPTCPVNWVVDKKERTGFDKLAGITLPLAGYRYRLECALYNEESVTTGEQSLRVHSIFCLSHLVIKIHVYCRPVVKMVGQDLMCLFLARCLGGSRWSGTRKEDQRKINMKISSASKTLLLGLALLMATSAFAANNVNKGSFEVFEPLSVSGHQLVAGSYDLRWDGKGSSVELMVFSHGKLVATVPARIIELAHAGRENAAELRTNDDGSQSLTQIDFSGKKYALAFGMESAGTGSTSQSGNQ